MMPRLLPVLFLLLAALQALQAAPRTEVLYLMPDKAVPGKAIEVADARLYRGEAGKCRTYDRQRWALLQFNRPFTDVMAYLHDSLSRTLNLQQPMLIRIRSFYLQEIRFRGSSMIYARLHYLAHYYRRNADSTYSLWYTADTTHPMQSYLLPVTATQEIRTLLRACLRACQSALPGDRRFRRDELGRDLLPEREAEELPEFSGGDGIFPSWEDLVRNRPQRSGEQILKPSGIGELNLRDTLSGRKSKLNLFGLYAYMRQGILYKCTRFGSFPLLRLSGRYLYAGYDERFHVFRPDAITVRKVSKRGGLTLSPDDVEHQKYLFAVDRFSGRPFVVCSLTPQDDYSAILMRLSQD